RPVAGAPRKERRQREQDPDPGQSASKRPMADAMANGAMESVGHGSAPVDKAVRPRASPRSCGAGVVVPNLARGRIQYKTTDRGGNPRTGDEARGGGRRSRLSQRNKEVIRGWRSVRRGDRTRSVSPGVCGGRVGRLARGARRARGRGGG